MKTQELIKGIDVPQLREQVKHVEIRTKKEAIGWIHLLSAIKYAEKEIKNKAYNFLDTRCKDCVEHYTDDETLGVKKVERTSKSYPKTAKMERFEKKIKNLESSIEEIEAVKAIRKEIEDLESKYEHEKLQQKPEKSVSRYYKVIK